MQPNYLSGGRGNKIQLPKLWRNTDLALQQMQTVRKKLPLPKMRIYWTLAGI
jgi:hypothetical protein